MSRAFVKESEGDLPDDLPELPISPHPNYVTSRGLALLRQRLQDAMTQRAAISEAEVGAVQQRAYLAREIRWLQARIASAQQLPAQAEPQQAGFGCVVKIQDESGQEYRYRIVGEDEANPELGDISWVSPLAMALRGKRVGDELRWPRPAGDVLVALIAIETGGGA